MSKSTKSAKSAKSEVVKTESRYAVHYARLRELQAERKVKRDEMIAKIEAAQQEYREYLEKYKAARKESEAAFTAAKKVTTEKPVKEVKADAKAEKKSPAKKVLKKAAAKNPAAKKA